MWGGVEGSLEAEAGLFNIFDLLVEFGGVTIMVNHSLHEAAVVLRFASLLLARLIYGGGKTQNEKGGKAT